MSSTAGAYGVNTTRWPGAVGAFQAVSIRLSGVGTASIANVPALISAASAEQFLDERTRGHGPLAAAENLDAGGAQPG